jgi:hypothetical protein
MDTGGGAQERNRITTVHHSHAVDIATDEPLCKRVKPSSLCMDSSINKVGEPPTCPACLKRLKKLGSRATPA